MVRKKIILGRPVSCEDIVTRLKKMESPSDREGMARFGINTENALGISVKNLRVLAREIGINHELAIDLWNTGIHEARLLAMLIEEKEKVTRTQIDEWVEVGDSWDIVDLACINMYRHFEDAWDLMASWCQRDEEYVKRAGYSLLAVLAVHDKQASDKKFIQTLKLIKNARDTRNFVKKSVSWALRGIGKRNMILHDAALNTAELMSESKDPGTRWVGKHARRELLDEKIILRIRNKTTGNRA